MPALANKTYFNYGGQGPLPESSLSAITDSWQKIQELGPFTNNLWPYIGKEINLTRQKLSVLCGVPAHRIALTENVTSGCILPMLGLPMKPGDHILISDCEHPGVVAACKQLAQTKKLEIDILSLKGLTKGVEDQKITQEQIIELLEKKIVAKTRLVVISHLLWNTGQLIPIEVIASWLNSQKSSPFLIVDGAQSFAQIPIAQAANVSDIYAFTGHKWACGPEGLGGVVLSERLLIESNPTLIGWRSIREEEVFFNKPNLFHNDSRKFEIATSCVPLLAGLRNSLDCLDQEGLINERLEKIKFLSSSLWKQLNIIKDIKPFLSGHPPSGLVSFSINKSLNTKDIVDHLGMKNIWIRDLDHHKYLRSCIHITTNANEVSTLIRALEELFD